MFNVIKSNTTIENNYFIMIIKHFYAVHETISIINKKEGNVITEQSAAL